MKKSMKTTSLTTIMQNNIFKKYKENWILLNNF